MKLKTLFAIPAILTVTSLTSQVRVTREDEHVNITINGKPFTAFYFGSDAPKPYLHPLRTVTGVVVTRSFPMDAIPGEDTDHPHQRGLWFTHGDVNGVNLWAEGAGMGKVVLKTLGKLVSGKDTGSLTADFQWQGPDGKPLLDESRIMSFTQIGSENIIDFELTLKPAGDAPVVLGDTKEGMFAIRLVKSLEEAQPGKCPASVCTGKMVSSEGGHGMKEIWGKRAKWVDYTGIVEGQKQGIAIFDSPKNPKHPAYWHARDYGLFAVNQFGEHDYYNDKSRNGSLKIEPGKSVTFKYRVLIHAGDTDSARIANQYARWSEKN